MIMKKLHFFTGKGGTGKSTNAILSALASKDATLLCSLDPAHNLKDILQVKKLDEIKKDFPSLEIVEPGIESLLRQYLEKIEAGIKANNTYLSSFNLLDNFDIIKFSPGLEIYAIFYGFKRMLEQYSDKKEILIFDMPPTGLSLRFFSLPQISLTWIEKLITVRNKILSKKKSVARIKKEPLPDDKVLQNLIKQKEEYENFKKLLAGAKIHVIVNPEPVSIAEAYTLVKELTGLGYNDIILHLNKYKGQIPVALKELSKDYPLIKVPGFANQPLGIERLTRHAGELG